MRWVVLLSMQISPSTTMYGGEMGLVWFWWAPCVWGCISSAKQAAGTPDSTSDIHSTQQFFYTLTPSLLQPNTYLLSFTISQQPRQGHLRSKLIVKVMEFLSNTNPWATVLCSTLHWKNSMWEFETTANLNSAQFWICTFFGSNFKYHSHVNSVWIQICLT